MPVVLGTDSRPRNVSSVNLDELLERGTCRLPTAEDASGWPWAVPYIHGVERWSIRRPVVVRGSGPSAHASMPSAYSVCINPRADGPAGDVAFAIDRQYWDLPMWREWQAKNLGAIAFWVNTNHITDPPNECFAYEVIPPAPRFKGFGEHRWAYVDSDGVMRRCFFSSIAAALVAGYLTCEPVILTGVDLSGVHRRGFGKSEKMVSYEEDQLPDWQAVAHEFDNVYCHEDMRGPLRDLFPTWKGAA